MSTNLETVLNTIQADKNNNCKPENIRYGTELLGVKGTLKPVTLNGGDTATCIYLQDETPTDKNGIWINTDKTYENIYVEDDRYTEDFSFMYSTDTSDSNNNTNLVKKITVPIDMCGSTTCYADNRLHVFGFYKAVNDGGSTDNTTERIHQHYMYDYSNNEWTKLADCPTPQGGGYAYIKDDNIYIFGTCHSDYYNYVYKYTISTDTWEKLPDIELTNWNNNNPVVGCDSINENQIFLGKGPGMYLYNLSNNSISMVREKILYDSRSVMNITLNNGYLAFRGIFNRVSNNIYISSVEGYLVKYAINNDTVSKINRVSTSTYGTAANSILVDDLIIWAQTTNSSPSVSGANIAGRAIIVVTTGSDTYSYINSKSSYSGTTSWGGNTVCQFSDIDGTKVICTFPPLKTTNSGMVIGVKLGEKEYNYDQNTLIVYTGYSNTGKYSTQLFTNSKILNQGKLNVNINDVNIYDATEKKLIKNLTTYYGNGTDWVKIK